MEKTAGKQVTFWSKLKKRVAKVKQVDMFGQSVSFLIDGESTYTTWVGAIVSVVIIGLTLTFASTKFKALTRRTDTTFSSYTKVGEQTPDFSYGQKEGFQIAF